MHAPAHQQIVVTLSEAAIAAIGRAVAGVEAHNPIVQKQAVDQARQAIAELRALVDCDAAETTAHRLVEIYDFIDQHLVRAGHAGDAQGLRETAGLLEELNQSWKFISC